MSPRVPTASTENGSASRHAQAVQLLEKAAASPGAEPTVHYLLFLACKRQGRFAEARNALRKIARPDANVLLQIGLLSLAENNLVQAESEFARAWELDPTCYEVCYNLLLTRLTLGQVDACLELLPRAVALIDDRLAMGQVELADDRRFLVLLTALLRATQRSAARVDPLLADLSAGDEGRLLKVIRSLGHLDIIHTLLRSLAGARPRSSSVREASVEAVLLKAKDLIDRCQWTEAELLLRPMYRERGISATSQVALANLLGCCACLTHDFDGAIDLFAQASKLAPSDPRLHQNLALCHELRGSLVDAEPHWTRYFEHLGEQVPAPPDIPGYLELIAYEGLNRLANRYAEKEKWSTAIGYLQRAAQVRPNDADTLEKLFHLYNQAKRPTDARRTLDQLRRVRPNEPHYELYELDLIEVKGLNDIERLLTEIDRIRKRYPDDVQVAERAVNMVGNVIPLMENLCDQLTDQLSRVVDQVRTLPNYQVNWSAVREVMQGLIKEFQKLRRITGKCLPLVSSDEVKRGIRDLAERIDRKVEACRSLGA